MSDSDSQDWQTKIQSEVIAAHTRLDAIGREISDIKTSQRSMSQSLQALAAKEPSKMPLFGQIAILAVMLTILSLVTVPIATRTWSLSEKLDDHADGHPVWVTEIMGEKFGHIAEIVARIDRQHADEHNEQEQDIGELREKDALFESRNDAQDERVTRLETQVKERTSAIMKLMNLRSADRWTGAQQRGHEENMNHRFNSLEKQLELHTHQ